MTLDRSTLRAAIHRRTLDAVGDWAGGDYGPDDEGMPDLEPTLGMTLHEYSLYFNENLLPEAYRPPNWRGDAAEVRAMEEAADA